ncbi:valyl-tRNA synthetase [Xylariaceae sp. AK1471]|nr:valyl-tRNA synthetase [Xylariaceae sp. AK1471]
MASTQASEKPMSEKQRLKLEKFASKREKQAQQQQQQQPNSVSKEKKSKMQNVPSVKSKYWLEETPARRKKILKPLDDDFHKAHIPKNGSLQPKGKYVIAIPPPNVIGKLHIGHALALSLQDTLIRWHRMRQFSTLYIPGCDHAGIATQAVFEKQLARHPKNGKSKKQVFSQHEFVQLCQDWKEDYHREINKTTRRLGASIDWSREAFTMNLQLSKAVTETFVQLHSEGLLYRANRLKIELGTLMYFKYPIEGSNQIIEVATTRPETMLGDTGITVHPQDNRYKDFVGKTALHPIILDRKLRIIADEYVEREFGTGAVKLIPAHDHDDFNLGKKHDLPVINILNEDGTLNSNAGHYAGEKRFNARYGVIEELKKLGLYTKQEPNKMIVPICSRSGDIVEPLLKPQWWMRMEPLTKRAIDVVDTGELVIRPELQRRHYLQWMRNLQDWCLSRQPTGAQEKAEEKFPGKKVTLKRDQDVLDTCRMTMFSLKLTCKVPFTEDFCHGSIRDSEGRKMSKSLDNVKKAFPQGIPEVGADALRFSLVHYTQASGSDINFDVKTMQGYRRFCNKIYQATKYVLGKLGDDFIPRESSALTGKESLPEKWILTKMNTAAKQINQALEERELSRSAQIIHRYLYDELFDIYIENSKSIISDGTPEEARSAIDTLCTTLEAWQRLLRRLGDNTSSSSLDDPRSETAYELVLGCSKGMRSLVADYAVKDKGVTHIAPLNQMSHNTASAQLSAIKSLSGKTPVDISMLKAGEVSPTGCAVFPVSADANVYLEVKDRIQDAGKEAEKVKAKLDEAMQSAESQKRDVEARLQALEETLTMFKTMMV